MKKHIIFGGALIAALSLASCSEVSDYDDWAKPATHDPEEALAAYGIEFTGSGIDVSMDDANCPDSIRLVSMSATSTDVAELAYKNITVNGCKIPYTIKGNDAYVGTYALDSLAQQNLKSRKHEVRALQVAVNAYAKLTNGTAVAISGSLVQNETPVATPELDSKGYYLLGNLDDNNWTPSKAIWMTSNGDGTYSATVTTAGDSNWFKFYGGSYYSDTDDWDLVNQGQLGCAKNGDTSTFNFVEWTDVQTPVISGAGKWKVTLDAVNWTYTITEVFNTLYLTGDHYSWGGTWKELTPVNGTDTDFWTIIYLHADEQFKFAPQAGWGNDFGMEATMDDQAGAEPTDNGGNIQVKNAGWYLLHVVNGSSRTVSFLKPNVYLNGSVAPNSDWSIHEENLFTVPTTEDGQFVSPAFAADGEVRICVNFGGYDWWKTEFIVADGKIDYRGKGGDQDRVTVSAGQKVYLDFTNGTGEYK